MKPLPNSRECRQSPYDAAYLLMHEQGFADIMYYPLSNENEIGDAAPGDFKAAGLYRIKYKANRMHRLFLFVNVARLLQK